MSDQNPNPFKQADAVEGAIGRALTELVPGRVIPESAPLLVSALRNEVVSFTLADGRTMTQGVNGGTVVDAVRAALARPEFGPLLSPPAPSPQQQAAAAFGRPLSRQEQISSGLLGLGIGVGRNPVPPGESLGEKMVSAEAARRQTHVDPRVDMGRPMGLSLKTR